MEKVLLVLVAALVIYGIRDEFPRIREVGRSGWAPATVYPVGAADFLASYGSPGDIIVSLDFWGSYLLWRLGPEQKIFEDSRHLYPERTAAFFAAYGETRKEGAVSAAWKNLFRQYSINIAVLPMNDERGGVPPLTMSLSHDPGWQPVYADRTAVVFKLIQ